MPLRIKVLRVMLEELLTRVRKLQTARQEDDLVQTLLKFHYLTPGENSNELRFSFLQWNPTQKALEIDTNRTALTMPYVANQITKNIDLATATGTDHQVRGPSPQCPDSAEHEQGANIDSSGDPMEAITCSLSQTLHGDALRMAGDDTLRRLAADLGKDEAGQLTANSTSLSLGEATRDHVITEDGKYLRGLSNPQKLLLHERYSSRIAMGCHPTGTSTGQPMGDSA